MYTRKLLHTEAFTHRRFYTQTLLHTDAFTHRHLYTQTLLHTGAFTHRHFYTQRLLHTEDCTHRSFYTDPFTQQKLLHTDAFTHRRFYTQTLLHADPFTHRSFYTQKRLHAGDFTHRNFYTQTLLHTDTFTQSTQKLLQRRFYTDAFTHRSFDPQHRSFVHTEKIAILPQFLAIDLHFVRKVCNGNPEIAILPQFLAIEPRFVRKGCAGRLANRNFTSVFDDRTSFRAKGLRRTTCKSQFYLSFWRSNLVSCERVAPDDLQIAILPQFLAIEPHSVRKDCVSCRLVGTAPAPAFKREIEKKERARGQDEKM